MFFIKICNYFLRNFSFFSLKIIKTKDINPGFKLSADSNYTNLLLDLKLKKIDVIPKIGYYSDNIDVLDPIMPLWTNKLVINF